MGPVVLYDACILHPAPLRDLFMRLALADLFRARWTEEIHDEWTRNVIANRPDISAESLARCRKLMNAHAPDSLVEGYERHIPTLSLPDPDDRHVLAAAIDGGASVIVTFNLRDFPTSVLEGYSIEAMHPDEFVAGLWDEHVEEVLAAVRRQREALKAPRPTVWEFLHTLKRCGLTKSAALLSAREDEI
jgi:predicted nucleic acid-binding protein